MNPNRHTKKEFTEVFESILLWLAEHVEVVWVLFIVLFFLLRLL